MQLGKNARRITRRTLRADEKVSERHDYTRMIPGAYEAQRGDRVIMRVT